MASLPSSAGFSSVCAGSRVASFRTSNSFASFQSAQTSSLQSTQRRNGALTDDARRRQRFFVSAYRQRRPKNFPPGTYEMVDEESGDRVVVLGIEGEEDNIPTDDQLQWETVENPKRGDISERAWARLLETDLPPGGPAYPPNAKPDSGSKEAPPKKLYPETDDLKSKGLFSRLKVQPIKKSERPRSTRIASLEDMEFSMKDGDNLVGIDSARKMKTAETSSRFEEIDKKFVPQEKRDAGISRIEATEGGLTRGPQNAENAPMHKGENRKTRASLVQKSSREVVAKDFFSIKSFKSLGANEKILQALQFMEMRRPSQIQALSYGHIVNGRSCILADQTGSGKTLAYLAPLFQRFLKEEEEGLSKSFPNRPRGLIMVPTSELASQVLNVCRILSKGGALLRSMVATGGFRLKTQVEALENCADIMIATPGRFLQLLDTGSLGLDNLKSIVFDEVDILHDDPEFSKTSEKIENLAPLKTQYIHVTATLPVDVCDSILEKHPTSLPLMGPGLHCTAAGLQEVLVDCSGEGEKNPETAFRNKKEALLQLVEQQPVSKTIIFCNKIETCRKVENSLKRLDRKGARLTVLPYHAALDSEIRLENMRRFMESDPETFVFLVCTDRASRGLDLVDVEHVVLFDFPRDPSEYVRRVGRTARAGGAGKAFVFVVGKQVSLARRIMVRNDKGHPIHSVPSHTQ